MCRREIREEVVGEKERQDTGCPREIGSVNEGLSAVAQTLGVVHGIADDMRVVMGGAPYFRVSRR